MKLYLVRHGEAEHPAVNPDRPLTSRGREGINRMAEYLKSKDIQVDAIWHSPKQRAIDTAQIIAGVLGYVDPLNEVSFIKPDDAVNRAIDKIIEVNAENERQCLMIVSHLPFLPNLIESLAGGTGFDFHFNFMQGTTVCLSSDANKWQLDWTVSPEDLT